MRLAVEAADIAARLMEAHETVHFGDLGECSVDRGVEVRAGASFSLDLHEGAEQRSRAAKLRARSI